MATELQKIDIYCALALHLRKGSNEQVSLWRALWSNQLRCHHKIPRSRPSRSNQQRSSEYGDNETNKLQYRPFRSVIDTQFDLTSHRRIKWRMMRCKRMRVIAFVIASCSFCTTYAADSCHCVERCEMCCTLPAIIASKSRSSSAAISSSSSPSETRGRTSAIM